MSAGRAGGHSDDAATSALLTAWQRLLRFVVAIQQGDIIGATAASTRLSCALAEARDLLGQLSRDGAIPTLARFEVFLTAARRWLQAVPRAQRSHAEFEAQLVRLARVIDNDPIDADELALRAPQLQLEDPQPEDQDPGREHTTTLLLECGPACGGERPAAALQEPPAARGRCRAAVLYVIHRRSPKRSHRRRRNTLN